MKFAFQGLQVFVQCRRQRMAEVRVCCGEDTACVAETLPENRINPHAFGKLQHSGHSTLTVRCEEAAAAVLYGWYELRGER